MTRVYANLDEILAELPAHEGRGEVTSRSPARRAEGTTFEASCYTDPRGTAPVRARLAALGRLATEGGYPVGVVIAPVMLGPGWREEYSELLDAIAAALVGVPDPDLTVELITHRFTDTSKRVLQGWYPGSSLDMDEGSRARKRTRMGSGKWVYRAPDMRELRRFFEAAIAERLPYARLLYFT